MGKLKKLLKKVLTREVIMYIIFGVLTTLVNLIVSFVLEGPFKLDGAWASAIGIVASILFAYFTNRKMVFNTTAKGFKDNFNEFIKFILGRAVTMVIEQGGVVIFYSIMGLAFMPVKLSLTIIVVILNFFFSKFFAFKKEDCLSPEDKKIKNIKILLGVLAFTIPLVIFLVIIYVVVYLNGPGTVLNNDMRNQYASFFEFLKRTLEQGNLSSLYHTLEKNDGSFIGLFGYYLASPINILFVILNNLDVIDVIPIVIATKIGIASLTAYIFLQHKATSDKKVNNYFFALVLSICYALCSYNIVYSNNIMWLDSVYLLPLMFLGIDRLIEKNKNILYIITLALSLIINYYTGFMMCIASAIYYVWAQLYKMPKINLENIKKIWKNILFYAISSILACGVACIMLVPIFLDLQEGKAASFNLNNINLKENCNIFEVYSKLFFGEGNDNVDLTNDGLPRIYTGTITLFFVLQYFISKKHKIKDKILNGVVIIGFFLCFMTQGLDLIWHGLSIPNWFPYRYSFVFGAFMVLFAYLQTISSSKEECRDKKLAIVPSIVIAISVLILNYMNLVNLTCTYITIVISFLLSIIIYKTKQNKMIYLLTILTTIEMLLNSYKIINTYANRMEGTNSEYRDREIWMSTKDKTQIAVNKYKAKQNEFYRIEKTVQVADNDPLLQDYIGFNHYSSNVKLSMGGVRDKNNTSKGIYEELGYANAEMKYNNGNTKFIDSFFNMKYILSGYIIPYSRYNYLENLNGNFVYENNTAFPFAYLTNKNLQNIKFDSTNAFENQNTLYKALTDSNENILTQVDGVTRELENITEIINEETDTPSTILKKTDANKTAKIIYKFKMDNDAAIYLYKEDEGETTYSNINIKVNEEDFGDWLQVYRSGVQPLGTFEEGTEVVVELELKENQIDYKNLLIYEEDENKLQDLYSNIKDNEIQLGDVNDNYITGKIDVEDDNQLLYFSIPYDKGWKVTVDGKEVAPIQVAEAMMAIQIDKGEHTIEMKYVSKGLKQGIIISGMSILIIVLFDLVIYLKKNKRKV